MKKEKKKMEIKNSYFLAGPLALVAFFLVDVIGGFNFPGYDWVDIFVTRVDFLF